MYVERIGYISHMWRKVGRAGVRCPPWQMSDKLLNWWGSQNDYVVSTSKEQSTSKIYDNQPTRKVEEREYKNITNAIQL